MAVLGLCGEYLGEIEELLNNSRWTYSAALAEEIGDFMWYLALYAEWHGVKLSKWSPGFENGKPSRPVAVPGKVATLAGGANRSEYLKQLRKQLGIIAEREKKQAHGSQKPWDQGDVEQNISIIYAIAVGIMRRCRIEPSDVYKLNIAKLEKRSGKTTSWADPSAATT